MNKSSIHEMWQNWVAYDIIDGHSVLVAHKATHIIADLSNDHPHVDSKQKKAVKRFKRYAERLDKIDSRVYFDHEGCEHYRGYPRKLKGRKHNLHRKGRR